jgi:hypothetical protein
VNNSIAHLSFLIRVHAAVQATAGTVAAKSVGSSRFREHFTTGDTGDTDFSYTEENERNEVTIRLGFLCVRLLLLQLFSEGFVDGGFIIRAIRVIRGSMPLVAAGRTFASPASSTNYLVFGHEAGSDAGNHDFDGDMWLPQIWDIRGFSWLTEANPIGEFRKRKSF